MKTQKLNIGDLVYLKDYNAFGMIEDFDSGYIKFTVRWFDDSVSHYSWMTTQKYRNSYLVYRKKMG